MNIESIVPYGNGGINREGRTLLEICRHPVPEALIAKLDELPIAPDAIRKIKADITRMGTTQVPQPAQNGHVDFSQIAWPGVTANLPDKDTLIEAIQLKSPNINLDDIDSPHIREITYYIGQQALAEKYGITTTQAARIIGLLDLVIHETEDDHIEIVPNNVHRFKQLYAHKGYVAKMLKDINAREVTNEDD